jgi:hypothetical protein
MATTIDNSVRICMTLANYDLVTPFLSPRSGEQDSEEPAMPVHNSEEGMRRLRDPFAVDGAGVPPAATDVDPG